MKFAVAVLLGLTSAVKVQQKATHHRHHHLLAQMRQSPSDIISMCDTDGSGGITIDEAHACIDKYVTNPEENKQANDMIEAEFDNADTNGDGELSEGELAAAMDSGDDSHDDQGPPPQGGPGGPPGPPPALSQRRGGGDRAQIRRALAQIKDDSDSGSDGPSAEDIMSMCDTDGSGGLTKREILDCINANVPAGPDRKQMKKEVRKGFAGADTNGDGELSEGELEAAMNSLAQTKQDPTPGDIMAMCDTDGSGGLSKKEILNCIDANVPAGPDRKQMKADVRQGFADADVNGDGELSEGELSAAMQGLAQTKQGPSAADIMGMCDTDGSGGLSKKEIMNCIDANVPAGPQRKEMKADVNQGFAGADTNGDGELSEGELAAAMQGLAQTKRHRHH